ncbi:MAG: TMEM175 family protein [Caulobacterales bacterium]|jgi:uncharacterized membrane protein
MDQDHDHLEKRRLDRMLFFTDAVFAIVMTLLVLELRPPGGADPAARAAAIQALAGPLFAFVLSFSIIGIFWVAHLATTQRLLRFDWLTTIVNLVFLLPICLVPFVSAWVGGALMGSDGWVAYDLVMIACSAGNATLVFVQTRGGGRLMAGGVTPRERLYRLGRATSPGLSFTVGLVGALAGYVRYSQFAWVLIPVFLTVCRLFLKPRAAPLAPPA